VPDEPDPEPDPEPDHEDGTEDGTELDAGIARAEQARASIPGLSSDAVRAAGALAAAERTYLGAAAAAVEAGNRADRCRLPHLAAWRALVTGRYRERRDAADAAATAATQATEQCAVVLDRVRGRQFQVSQRLAAETADADRRLAEVRARRRGLLDRP